MRFLGIDYGKKRIGLAISDEMGSIAFPKEILPNDNKVFERLAQIIKEDEIGSVVIGESTNFDGMDNKVAKEIESFIKELENRFKLPISKQKEFLTSVEARKPIGNQKERTTGAHSRAKKEKSGEIDDKAAALILQRYLDRRHIAHNT